MRRPSRHLPRHRAATALAAVLLAVTACQGGEEDDAAGGGETPASPASSPSASASGSETPAESPDATTAAPTASGPASSPAPSEGGDVICPDPSALDAGRKSGDGAGLGAGVVPRLQEVRVAAHPRCDRVVFDFENAAPGWFAWYEEPLRSPGRGDAVRMPGESHLKFVLSGVPRDTRVRTDATTATLRGIKHIGYFEGELSLGLGIDTPDGEPAGFRVRVWDDKVVLDIAHTSAGG
ncbi:hypothetical protein [Streptomyces sp. JJ36]|uniref:AMIN-like domain-containing (lipo)protein n=1 Tax=Streptomyces sp. JJ36 TaxID=2736645 RepID=UPI001F228AFB|nr:hypothetical protein [Streptomyces sp. JJ36]MCF6521950.1 hypothetical protein [Streptomyces sp. JJ36]